MEFFITTDTHFQHENIKRFSDRPEGFEEIILNELEKKTNHNNILIHLGDIAWKQDQYWNRRVTSQPYHKKWLIRGNHDKKSNSWYLSNGWDFVGESLTIQYDGKLITFSHKPIEIKPPTYNIHGHFHNISMERIKKIEPDLYAIYKKPNHILLALEHTYIPYNLQFLLNDYERKQKTL